MAQPVPVGFKTGPSEVWQPSGPTFFTFFHFSFFRWASTYKWETGGRRKGLGRQLSGNASSAKSDGAGL